MSGMERYLYNHNGITTPQWEVGRSSQKLPTDRVHGKADNGNTGELEGAKTKSARERLSEEAR
jgi:hypothetical protein